MIKNVISNDIETGALQHMRKYILDKMENRSISNLIDDILKNYNSAEDEFFLLQAGLLAHELPKGLRAFLNDFKQHDDIHPSCLIEGYKIDNERIGKSPKHWRDKNFSSSINEEIYFVLCASLTGHPIAWSTQQAGRIVHDIFPIKEHENDQLGFSSKENLEWHTEDAFHPLRGDYIALMCIRNPSHTPTMIASTTDIDLTLEEFKPLFKPIFKIRPDNSHLQAGSYDPVHSKLSEAQEAMYKHNQHPQQIPVLFGDPKNPYWRLDPYFMETPEDKDTRKALRLLIRSINNNLKELILSPGDIFFCDNYRVVHGRAPFSANYDGWDRWLKRLNIVIDLRKSRAVRTSGISRIFY